MVYLEITENTKDLMETKIQTVEMFGSQSADQATEQRAANTEVIISNKKPRTLFIVV